MSDQTNEHGLAPSAEITAKDGAGAFADPAKPQAPPAPAAPADPTQNGKTLPIGGADGQQGDVYKPQGLAEHLIGQSNNETIDRLQKAYDGARAELAKGKPAIPAAGEYKFEWPDAMKGSVAADDQAVAAFSEIAHKRGFTQDQIAAIPEFFALASEKGWIEKPFDSGALLESLAPDGYQGTAEQKQQRGSARVLATENWIKQLDPTHGFDDAMKMELRLLTTSRDGVRAIETLMKGGVVNSVAAGGGHQPAAVTKQTLDARVADPRNDTTKHDYDPAYAEETRKMFRQLYPD